MAWRWRYPLRAGPFFQSDHLGLFPVRIDLKSSGSLDATAALAAMKRPEPVLRAAGLVVVSVSQRAFTESSLRPSTWAPLASSTLKQRRSQGRGSAPLLKTGLLSRSPRIGEVSSSSVSVVSDRSYAAYQQLGTKRTPARPFFPFDSAGRPTPRVKILIRAAAIRALGL